MSNQTITENRHPDSLRDLIAFVSSEFAAGRVVNPDEKLIVDLVDSLGIFLVVDFVQQRFGVELADRDLTVENLATTRTLTALVETKLQERILDVRQTA